MPSDEQPSLADLLRGMAFRAERMADDFDKADGCELRSAADELDRLAARNAVLEDVARLGHEWWNAQAHADATGESLRDAEGTQWWGKALDVDNAAGAEMHNAEHRFWASLRAERGGS